MEATFGKQSSAHNQQERDKPHARSQKAEAGKNKEWWEQLAEALSKDKEEQNKWHKTLAHPFAIVTALIALGYWWFNQKANKCSEITRENEQLKIEIDRLKRKCKKLKKRIRDDAGPIAKRNLFALLD
jgi:hypothetical protein